MGTVALLFLPMSCQPSANGKLTVERFEGATLRLERDVTWEIALGQVKRAFVTGPRAPEVDIQLPLPKAYCVRVARALRGRCRGAVVRVETPLVVDWGTPQTIEGSAVSANVAVLTPTGRTVSAEPYALGIGTSGGRRPKLCFSAGDGSQLGLGIGTIARRWRIPTGGFALSCPQSLLLRVAGARSQPGTTALFLNEIDNIDLKATSAHAAVDGAMGNFRLRGEEDITVGPTDTVELKAEKRLGIHLALDAGGLLVLGPASLSSAKIDGEERIESLFDRYRDIWIALIAVVWGLAAIIGGVIVARHDRRSFGD